RLRRVEVVGGDDGAGRLQRETPGENGEAAQHGLLDRWEEVVAPVESRPQGLVARERRAVAPREESKPIVEMCSDLVHPEGGGPSRRQLDGERDPIEASTDRPRDRRGSRVRREARLHRSGPGDEQTDRGGLAQLLAIA